jgi:hypothetical protein
MGAASLLENIIERSINDLVQFWDQLQSRADASSIKDFEARLKVCEHSYDDLLRKLQRAKEMAASPELLKALKLDWLQIENGACKREIERLQKELTRIKGKLPENNEHFRTDLERERKRAADAEQDSRALREENKSYRAAIARFKGKHQVEPSKHKRRKKRTAAQPIRQGEGLFAISAREARLPKEQRQGPKQRKGKRRKSK